MKIIAAAILLAACALAQSKDIYPSGPTGATSEPRSVTAPDLPLAVTTTHYREVARAGKLYVVAYEIPDSSIASSPATYPPGPAHYSATVSVYLQGRQLGSAMKGTWVDGGCPVDDVPDHWLDLALKGESDKAGDQGDDDIGHLRWSQSAGWKVVNPVADARLVTTFREIEERLKKCIGLQPGGKQMLMECSEK